MLIDYTNLHTKQLLNLLHSFRQSYSPFEFQIDFNVEYERIKAELAKRPHIPNKIEAKAIRKAKAKKSI